MQVEEGSFVSKMAAMVLTFVALMLLPATAQIFSLPSGNAFVGFSYSRSDILVADKSNLYGFEGSLEFKVFPHIGGVADVSGYYLKGVHEYDFLFGPRFYMTFKRKYRPFAEVLVGLGHENYFDTVDTTFAEGAGVGFDRKFLKLFDWRVEGDYLQTKNFSFTQKGVRVSTGLVFHF